jgi:hypothetical protein
MPDPGINFFPQNVVQVSTKPKPPNHKNKKKKELQMRTVDAMRTVVQKSDPFQN